MPPPSDKRSREQTRPSLGHAVEVVLTRLSAVESRFGRAKLLAALNNLTGSRTAHGDRLRDVLDRDRALVAARSVAQQESAPASAPSVEAPSVAAPTPAPAKPPARCDEPIRTRTMARLLGAQGHRERALSIYDHLLALDDSDASLRAEADLLRAQAG